MKTVPDSRLRCNATTQQGMACRAAPVPGRAYCLFHDPAKAASQTHARRAGGRERSKPAAVVAATEPDLALSTVHEVGTMLADAINRVRKGTLDTKIANTLGFLAGVLIKSIETGEMEQRLAALESAVTGQGGATGESAFDRPAPMLEACR